jgi:hypothetical protein
VVGGFAEARVLLVRDFVLVDVEVGELDRMLRRFVRVAARKAHREFARRYQNHGAAVVNLGGVPRLRLFAERRQADRENLNLPALTRDGRGPVGVTGPRHAHLARLAGPQTLHDDGAVGLRHAARHAVDEDFTAGRRAQHAEREGAARREQQVEHDGPPGEQQGGTTQRDPDPPRQLARRRDGGVRRRRHQRPDGARRFRLVFVEGDADVDARQVEPVGRRAGGGGLLLRTLHRVVNRRAVVRRRGPRGRRLVIAVDVRARQVVITRRFVWSFVIHVGAPLRLVERDCRDARV